MSEKYCSRCIFLNDEKNCPWFNIEDERIVGCGSYQELPERKYIYDDETKQFYQEQ